MQNNTIEELIQLKQEGKIGWCELALRTESRIYDGGNDFAEEFAEALV